MKKSEPRYCPSDRYPTGNAAVGRPAATVSLRGLVNVIVRVEALRSEVHSGMFGGPAPDALAALVAMLATLRDGEGNTTITGLDNSETWRASRIRLNSCVVTLACSMAHRFWEMAV